MAIQKITLKCGKEVEIWGNCATIDITALYKGCEKNNFISTLEALQELKELGYTEGDGIELETGYYDSIDGASLNLSKSK